MIWLVVAALLLQAGVGAATWAWGDGRFAWTSDAEGYLHIADTFRRFGVLAFDFRLGPQSLRTPVYPFLVAGTFFLFGHAWPFLVAQQVLGALTVAMTYLAGKRFFSATAGRFAAVALMLESTRLQNTSQYMTETVFLFLLLTAILFFQTWLVKYRAWSAIAAGLCFGLATLTRPVAVFFPLILVLWTVVFHLVGRRVPWQRLLLASGLLLVVHGAVLAPWLLRQHRLFGVWSLASGGDAYAYFIETDYYLRYVTGQDMKARLVHQAIRALDYRPVLGLPADESFRRFGMFEAAYMPQFRAWWWAVLKEAPLAVGLVHAWKTGLFFIESGASRSYHAVFFGAGLPAWLFYPFLFWAGRLVWAAFACILVAGLVVRRPRQWFPLLMCSTVVLQVAVALAMNPDAPRMRLSALPLYLWAVGDGWARLEVSRRWRRMLASIVGSSWVPRSLLQWADDCLLLFAFHLPSSAVRRWFHGLRGVSFGTDVWVGHNVVLGNHAYLLTVGDAVTIASGAQLLTHDTSFTRVGGRDIAAPIHIGNRVHIGAGAVILPGVTIGEGSVVGAQAVVTHDVPPGSVMVGVPAHAQGTVAEALVQLPEKQRRLWPERDV